MYNKLSNEFSVLGEIIKRMPIKFHSINRKYLFDGNHKFLQINAYGDIQANKILEKFLAKCTKKQL